MLGVGVSRQGPDDAGEKVRRGVRRAMRDAADAGFRVSQEEVPKDTGAAGLMGSGVPPTWDGDRLVWGYTAPYAEPVEEGSAPHWAPIQPLRDWARRVLGDEDAAYAVQWKIAQEGTPAQPYVKPGIQAMLAELQQRGVQGHITAEFER